MRLGFVTCVKIGLNCMEAIYQAGEKLDLAITLDDNVSKNKSGRVYIEKFCIKHNIPLLKTVHINSKDVISSITNYDIDWLFIIGWSQIANLDVLNSPNKGVIGMHPTLLPEGRGRASIPWAIIKNLKKTGVTMFKMDTGVDTGPIIAQMEVPLNKEITSTKLYNQIVNLHSLLVKKMITPILQDNIKLTPQDHYKATVWPGRKPKDGEINLKGSVYDAEKLVRATAYPYPKAFYYRDGKKHIVSSATILQNMKIKPDLNAINFIEFKDGILIIDD